MTSFCPSVSRDQVRSALVSLLFHSCDERSPAERVATLPLLDLPMRRPKFFKHDARDWDSVLPERPPPDLVTLFSQLSRGVLPPPGGRGGHPL